MSEESAAGRASEASPARADHESREDALQREIDRSRAQIFALKRQLADRERRISELLSSTSWRITAPLRTAAVWLRQRRWLGRRPGTRHVGFAIDTEEYQRWLSHYSGVDDAMRTRLAAQVGALASRPLISVIMPSYNIDPKWMREAIESVRRQIYPYWELCISDDASTLSGVRTLLEGYAADDRIRVMFRATNGHISANSNSALDLARGDYVALMDADDVLPEDALFWVAHEIALHPDVDLIFTDEDKIDESGRRFDPYFKPAWNPALMTAQNAFCHLGVYRRSLVEQVGRFREGREGAQDHDLVLRCADATTPRRIRHIPRVLYHWRASAQSTAASLESKPYASNAGLLSVEEHLARHGVKAQVEPAAGSFYRANYPLPDPPPLVSIVMPSTLRDGVTRRCLQSVLGRTRYDNFELLLVASEQDLAASRASFADLLADPRVRVVSYATAAFNYSRVNNLGGAQARGDLLCFLNDDVEAIGEDWLAQLVARVSLDGVAAAGPMLYYPSDRIQHAGVLLGVGEAAGRDGVADHAFRNVERGQIGYFARAALEQDYSCLTAACLLVRRSAFEAAGGFDVTLPTAFNDVDFCIRLRRSGARLVWTPAAELYHHESLTFGPHNAPARAAEFDRDVAAMRARWSDILDSDPCYNPNLSLQHAHQFKLAAPPRTAFALSDLPLGTAVSRTSELA